LGATVQNLVAMATWRLGFLNPCIRPTVTTKRSASPWSILRYTVPLRMLTFITGFQFFILTYISAFLRALIKYFYKNRTSSDLFDNQLSES